MSKKNTYKLTNEIFIGLEYIYPDIDLLPKIRLALKRLTFEPGDDKIKFNDFFNLIETFKTFPITPYLKGLISPENSMEKIIAIYKLLDHLSHEPDYENFWLFLKNSQSTEDQSESMEKILIQWLKDKSKQPQFAYCEKLVGLILEKDPFEKTQKTLDFYNLFQKKPEQQSKDLKKLPITPYLKGLISPENSMEKIIAIYKLLDHLSHEPDYENFWLFLKNSQSTEDQSESMEKILIQWLKDKSKQPQFAYCEKLVGLILEKDPFEKTQKTLDFYNLFQKKPEQQSKDLKKLPITPYLKGLISPENSMEKIIAIYKLLDHLSHEPDYENFWLFLKNSQSTEDQSESMEKILIQWLKDKSKQPQFAYCEKLVGLILEKDPFEKTQKTLDFYNLFQKKPEQQSKDLKKLPITPYLKGLISPENSMEKIIAIYKLLDHLSHEPDYENFWLFLKNSQSTEDQSESMEKILIQWLKDKSKQPQFAYCEKLVGLILEKDPFEKTQKTLDFYNLFQKKPEQQSKDLKKLPITPYLKGLISPENSMEKIIAIYKLLDHLSHEPDYENFWLFLKNSQSTEDQSESMEKILIQWLKDKSKQPQFAYCEKLVGLILEKDPFEKTQKTLDFYNLFYKNLPQQSRDLPLTKHLRNILSTEKPQEKIIAIYKLLDHLSHEPDYENFRLLLKHSQSTEDQSESMEKILIQWLKDKSKQPQFAYCEKLVNLILEKDPFEKTQKTLDFYNLFYKNLPQQSRDLPLTKHLRNILSTEKPQEKIIAIYKLLDHLSHEPDYENFRLLLKHSQSTEDQSESMEKILIQWLKDKSKQPQFAYCEKLVNLILEKDPFEKTQKTLDFYNLFYKNLPQQSRDLPLTKHLRNILSTEKPQEKIIAIYKLLDHLSHEPDYENFRLLLKHSQSTEDQSESMEKILIQWLKDKSKQPQFAYCEKLVNLILEKDPFEKTQKTLDFYNLFYKNLPQQSRDLPLTKHLRNILSTEKPQEKIIAIYKLLDHLSHEPDYENFRLLLKHSQSTEDQSESMEKILIQWLKDKSKQPQFAYCEKLVGLILEKDPFEKTQKTLDFYNLFYKNLPQQSRDLPLTKHLRNILSTEKPQEKIIAIYKLLDHLSHEPDYENFRLLLKHSQSTEDQSESMEKILIQWLKDKSKQPQFAYCEKLVNLILEKDPFEKIQKTLDFYNLFYQNPMLKQLKKAYKHFVFEESSLQFINFIYQITGKSLLNQIKVILSEYKKIPIQESFSKGQILSKLWARDCFMNLNLNSCQTGLILCGWSGILSNLLLEKPLQNIVSVDKDPDFEPIAIRLNYEDYIHGRFNAITKNIFDLNYNKLKLNVNKFSNTVDQFDIIINTSCEHFQNFNQWYDLLPKGQLLLLQSNDFFDIVEHTNCVDSLETFKTMAPMNHLLFEGELPLENYTRFMLIGYK